MRSRNARSSTTPRSNLRAPTRGFPRRSGGNQRPVAVAASALRPSSKMDKVDVEVKHLDTTQAYIAISTAGIVTNLTATAQGVASNQHLGDQKEMVGLDVGVTFQGGTSGGNIRCILFQWLDDNSLTVPSVANVLQNPGGALATVSPYNFNTWQEQNLRVLKDVSCYVSPAGSNISLPKIDWKIASDLGQVVFNAGATTGRGHFYVLLVGDAAATQPLAQLWGRALYTDA